MKNDVFAYFNPRTPCGVRPVYRQRVLVFRRFQSTHPLRGATRASAFRVSQRQNFNPRTPCGVRPASTACSAGGTHFNPRTPCGVRPVKGRGIRSPSRISIHAPLAGCDGLCDVVGKILAISIHAPLAGCDPRASY